MKHLRHPLAFLALSTAVPGATVHVTSGQSIQAAINAATAGDIIMVGPGTYNERLSIAKNVTLSSSGGAGSTTINGSNGGTTISVTGPAEISGFTITGGNGGYYSGGGMNVLGSGARITSNIFTGNTSTVGSAITCDNASSLISGNIFTLNTAGTNFNAGTIALVNTYSTPKSAPVIQNNLFFGNTGRGINVTLSTGSTPLITNNTIVGNSAAAVRLDARVDTTGMTFQNNILANNLIGFEVQYGQLKAAWRNNLLYGNTTGYAGITSLTDLYGNIEGNPLFADLANNDYHLLAGSPAIDAGTNLSAPTTDFEGRGRPLDANHDGIFTADIGAYEFIPEPAAPVLLGLGALAAMRRRRSVRPEA